jgi:hypothetical protein
VTSKAFLADAFRAADKDDPLAAAVVSFNITVRISPTFLARRSSNSGL